MHLQVQKGPHCLLYAAATVLDVPPDVLRTEIGYSGNEEWWPEAKFPANIRSFHIQEINECFIRRGMILSLIERFPRTAPAGMESAWKLINKQEELNKRFFEHLNRGTGILIGPKPSGMKHAVAWDGEKIYDTTPPEGKIVDLNNCPIEIMELWLVSIIKS